MKADIANSFADDALDDLILPLAVGMHATTAALASFVVAAVLLWWGWYCRTVCG